MDIRVKGTIDTSCYKFLLFLEGNYRKIWGVVLREKKFGAAKFAAQIGGNVGSSERVLEELTHFTAESF